MRILSVLAKTLEKQKLNFSRSALFYMKTRVCLKYFVNHYSLRINVFVRFRNGISGADLVDMKSLSSGNGGIKCLLVVIDVNIKYGLVKSLTDKEAKTIPEIIVGQGKEFFKKCMKKFKEIMIIIFLCIQLIMNARQYC